MSDKTNVLPNNLEAEQSLIGCMLIDNEVLSEIADKLSDRDFYQESHQMIVSAILKVFYQRKPADLITLCDCLEKDGNLAKVGGIDYITELMQKVPSAANFRYYFDIVKRDSIHRIVILENRSIGIRIMPRHVADEKFAGFALQRVIGKIVQGFLEFRTVVSRKIQGFAEFTACRIATCHHRQEE